MRKLILEIEFDDTDCYEGYGEDTIEIIKNSIKFEIDIIEQDGVIKKGWTMKEL